MPKEHVCNKDTKLDILDCWLDLQAYGVSERCIWCGENLFNTVGDKITINRV